MSSSSSSSSRKVSSRKRTSRSSTSRSPGASSTVGASLGFDEDNGRAEENGHDDIVEWARANGCPGE
jgi:hypothetical protein